jgi:predicted nucleic acid-binding protein
MNDRVFLDTNVLVYLFDADAPAKQRHAREFIARYAPKEHLMLSTQVLQEFYVCVTRKLATPLDPDEALRAVQYLASWPVVQIDTPLIILAITRSRTAKLSFWDALIVEAALAGGATHLYTEDFQDGQMLEDMQIANPFKKGLLSKHT